MIRDLLHIFRVREDSLLNITEEEKDLKNVVLKRDKKKKNESKGFFGSNTFYQPDKPKPQTVDVAVGDDDVKKKNPSFRCFNYFRKGVQVEKTETKQEDAIDKFWHSFHKEALIATREVVASTCASVFAILFSHPLDVVKSHYQTLRYPRWREEPATRRQKFLYVLLNIYRTKGLKRFYKYHLKSQTESMLQMFFVFWTYQRTTEFLDQHFEYVNEDAANFFAGFFSATIPVCMLHPLFNYRMRQDIRRNLLTKYGEPVASGFDKQLKYWRPLYRGGWAMFMHMSVLNGFRFMFYEKIRDHFAQAKTTSDKATDTDQYVSEVDSYTNFSNIELLTAGALAAILGDVLAHPLDVIRSRLAMDPLNRQQYWYNQTCRSFYQCVKLIWTNEKLWAFYAGLTPCILRSTVNTALAFAVYEKVRHWLRNICPT